MSEIKKFRLTCIVCPLGCTVEVTMEGDRITGVEGFTCPRGKDYAIQEIREPKRIVMSVVKVRGGRFPTVAVKSDRPVPKELIPAIMKKLAEVEVEAPVSVGQVIVENVLGTGANIVATREA
ncbi:DUF1667 domain-containing protein [Thermococcus thioreducens]|uniref:CxxC motif-containing protein n=1 Tax=Thermococcus thioreducens TaxID=277988 RepID=A0A0Q2S7J7_9EURY|nr:DUF1667 domain-containing protein [Thermococcus thioreducens]ASJ13322.1 molybdopterin oxidoreductase [Thermococcus thioreducens]KQH83267.1 molybdopterin oxidoreductase [Thermococcus thioreducens]SEW22636.1 CxxC motif-containing protein [Thermococcus thioreducens]